MKLGCFRGFAGLRPLDLRIAASIDATGSASSALGKTVVKTVEIDVARSGIGGIEETEEVSCSETLGVEVVVVVSAISRYFSVPGVTSACSDVSDNNVVGGTVVTRTFMLSVVSCGLASVFFVVCSVEDARVDNLDKG